MRGSPRTAVRAIDSNSSVSCGSSRLQNPRYRGRQHQHVGRAATFSGRERFHRGTRNTSWRCISCPSYADRPELTPPELAVQLAGQPFQLLAAELGLEQEWEGDDLRLVDRAPEAPQLALLAARPRVLAARGAQGGARGRRGPVAGDRLEPLDVGLGEAARIHAVDYDRLEAAAHVLAQRAVD